MAAPACAVDRRLRDAGHASTAIGFCVGRLEALALGGMLIAGIAFKAVVFLQHCTFSHQFAGATTLAPGLILSKCSARDLVAHGCVHLRRGLPQFSSRVSQHDYRNWRESPGSSTPRSGSTPGRLQARFGLAISCARCKHPRRFSSRNWAKPSAGSRRSSSAPLLHRNRAGLFHARFTSAFQASASEWAHFKDMQMEITREMIVQLRIEIRSAIESLKLRDHEFVRARCLQRKA